MSKEDGGEPDSRGQGLDRTKYLSIPKIGFLFAVVVVGVFTGLYTATEAAALGAVAALFLLIFGRNRSTRSKWRSIADAFVESAVITSRVYIILVGAALLTTFLVVLGVPSAFGSWASDLPIPGEMVILLLLLLMVPLGMFLDPLTIILVFIPIVFPVVEATGYNPIVFGILTVKLMELGMVTPPVGMNIFVVASVVPGIKAEDVFRGVIPYYLADVAFIVLIMVFPQIVLFLPNLMMGPG